MQSNRSKKVAIQLKNEIGNILQTQIKDPLIGFVTITNVQIADLKIQRPRGTIEGSIDSGIDMFKKNTNNTSNS